MEFILYEQKGATGIITINRERALNALNSTVLEELDATLDAVNLDEVRCLILTGAGQKSFVAGADIGEMSNLTKAEGEAFGKKGNDVFRKLETFPIPVIAAINYPGPSMTSAGTSAEFFSPAKRDMSPMRCEG